MNLNEMKQAVVEYAMPDCPFVHVYMKMLNEQLPPHMRTNEWSRVMVLQLGQDPSRMKIRDLVVDQYGFMGEFALREQDKDGDITHSFCRLRIPWNAVFAVLVFEGKEAVFQAVWGSPPEESSGTQEPEPAKKPNLRLV